jgi:hypothetical protein
MSYRAKFFVHANVYLDSPSTDYDILGPAGQVYCLPVQMDSRRYLICLLLQERIGMGNFRRIGLTSIPPYDSDGQQDVLERSGDEEAIPHCDWDAEAGKHTICIV